MNRKIRIDFARREMVNEVVGIKEACKEEDEVVQGEVNQEVMKCIDRCWLLISTTQKRRERL